MKNCCLSPLWVHLCVCTVCEVMCRSHVTSQIQREQTNNRVLKDFKLASHWPWSGPNVGNDLFLVLNVLKHLLWIIAVHPFLLLIFII